MNVRNFENWLLGYRDFTKLIHEAPDIYHLWTGIAIIATALRRKVCLYHPPRKLYSNFYIVLVGKSGKCRKSGAIDIGLEFLSEIPGINIAAEDITREALIRDLSNAAATYTNKEGVVETHSSLLATSKELSVFLGVKDIKLLATLTDLFDCHDKWDYRTKNKGTDYIKGLWFSLLGATDPVWLSEILPVTAVGGGFTSRIIFVVAEERARDLPRGERPQEAHRLKALLLQDLLEIAKMQGIFTWGETAGTFYDTWYKEQKHNDTDWWLTGYYERKPTHAVKVATILSAATSSDMVIQKEHITKALEILNLTELNMPRAFGGLGRSLTAQDVYRVLEHIRKAARGVSMTELMQANWMHLSKKQLDEVLSTLTATEKVYMKSTGSEILYHYKD